MPRVACAHLLAPSEICRVRRFRSVRTAGQYQDGLRRSDATDRSPLHSGTCVCAHVYVCVRVCACVCVCVRACLTDENRALRDISTHKPPATSKPAQAASFLSRGEVPEAEIGTRRRASPVALARTWHFGHHYCTILSEFPTLEAAWG